MNIQEIYELGIAQGWDEEDALYLAQLAWAESKGDRYAMEYLPDNDLDKQYSFGIWQINLQHIQNLIDADIGDWPEGWPESITGSTDLFYSDGSLPDEVRSVIQDVMANPVVNAEAAQFVGHRMDYGEPWEDWDFTRWTTHGLDITDENHPSNYGGDISREQPEVETEPEPETEPESETGEQGGDPTGLGNFEGPGWLDPDDYVPGEGQMPVGFLPMWGEDNATVGDWLDMWVERYNVNNERDIPYSNDVMDRDYLWDPTDGLYAQGWWSGMTTDFTHMIDMWYTHGGPGAVFTGTPPPGLVDVDGGSYNPTFDLGGEGDWKYIWDGSIDVIRATIEDLGIDPDILGNSFVNEMALDLMARGGATAHLSPQSRPNWDDEAVQLIESRVISQWFDDDGNFMPDGTYGAGTVKDVEDELRAFARSQMLYDIEDDEFREWALAIKSERGLSQSQVEAEIADRAYGFWGLDSATKHQMLDSGLTIGNKISPLYAAATDVWGDTTVTPNDSWLMDNYQVTGDDGVTRFRSGPEMRRAARGNLERFQYSDDYQDPLNRFITGATRMFRSDY